MSHHLAQVKIGRIRAPMDSPIMAPFAQALDEINALARLACLAAQGDTERAFMFRRVFPAPMAA